MAYAHPEGGATVPTRKGADQDAVILREFKRKLAEDEGYISYFSERLAIEQQYIDQLNKLHGKTVSADVFYDDVPHPRARVTSSARRAWFEVRDYTQREIQAREAMVNALRIDVLDPLVALRDTQTRIRNRIREDLKTATDSYEDYAFTKVPKMQRTYKAKTQAVEDFKRQEHAVQMQAKLLAEQSPKEPTESRPHPYSHGHSASQASVSSSWASGLSDMGGGPGGTPPMSPQSQHSPHTAQPSISTGPSFHVQPASPGSEIRPEIRTVDPRTLANANLDRGNRARSGSGSYAATMQAVDAKSKEVFSDIASHSKKGFAAIMQRLGGDRDGELATSGPTEQASMARRGSVRANGAVKSAKIKREAEDADKQYRTGVFHLESLRLRREKLQRSAITSLGQFNDELNATLLVTMRAFTDVTHGSAATLAQLSQTPRQSLRSVNLEHDTMLFRSRLPVVQRYAPLLYDNYYVGKCRSLIFGVSLTDYDFARGEGGDHGRPPLIVEKCIAWIDALGFEAEGIYRLSGRQATVRKLIQGIERDEEEFNFTQEDDVHSVAVVLKAYLRELPEPLFHLPHAERIKWTESREAHFANNFSTLRGRLRRLPPIHQTTFQAIIEHLNRVSEHHHENKMDAKNLAVVFNSVLFGQEQLADADALKMHLQKDTVLEDMISHPELLFGPAGEPGPSSKPSSTTGSARTKFEVRPQILQQTSNPSITGLSHIGSGGHPSAIPVAQHPIASQHSRSASWASQQLPLTPQEPINFDPPTHGAVVQPPVRPPPMHMTGTTPPLPAGAGLPFQPPHPHDPLSQSLSQMSMDPRPIGLDSVLNGRSGLTPDAGLELLFDKNKIPASMRAAFPDDFHVRPLASDDFLRAHFGLLSHLSASPALAPSVYTSLFKALKSCADTYYIVVIVERSTDQIVASGTVVKERKFIHGGGCAGHIEDIVVGPTAQGKGLGIKLVTGLRELATSLGCYKTILDCQDPKVPFYEKCGFTLRGRQMAYYVPTADAPPRRESLANTGMGHSHPPTPARLPPLPTDEEDGNDSSVETVETGETGDTEGTGVTYRFPTSGATTNLAGVAAQSPAPLSPTSTGTGTETPATITRADSVRRQESTGTMTPATVTRADSVRRQESSGSMAPL